MNSISIKIQEAKTTRNTGETNQKLKIAIDQTVTESLNLVKNVRTERGTLNHIIEATILYYANKTPMVIYFGTSTHNNVV